MRKEIAVRFFETGIIPVIKINNPEHAVPLGKALLDGGISVAEITYRTPAAGEAIRRMHDAFPDMLIAAGTVLTVEQAEEALKNGADCLVSPSLPEKLAKYCTANDISFMPGICTPTEINTAMELGQNCLKFYPASNYGGLKTIKAFLSVFGNITIMPTGGISLENAAEYLEAKGILCCGGSFIAPTSLIDAQDFSTIQSNARQVCELVGKLQREIPNLATDTK
ncbi:MAG: bifunctional 4-hydroxy-2-oxoglutarate aldolase/2-dehydro-3-deoxy-phosphogluconate aldolase [Desulfovibrio sp.]|uniref:bifunctional 4-hydroxy-2-oxoglutarate aldolase/2-dehydro-3-deoxy-phosphogluconate aldolase n=1 Tax=Desulfovibrio sp. 7SRBS1 TaxID=3378064 RepID=UPI003B3C4B57